jgi:F-type H+-transporting ATPase subunit b
VPQLEVETFASQIFWVMAGFLAVYLFVSRMAAPGMTGVMEDRNRYLDGMTTAADRAAAEARALEESCEIAKENAAMDSYAQELKLKSSFLEQTIREKEMLREVFAKKMKAESLELKRCCDDVYEEIVGNMDASLVKMATEKILATHNDAASAGKEGRHGS